KIFEASFSRLSKSVSAPHAPSSSLLPASAEPAPVSSGLLIALCCSSVTRVQTRSADRPASLGRSGLLGPEELRESVVPLVRHARHGVQQVLELLVVEAAQPPERTQING